MIYTPDRAGTEITAVGTKICYIKPTSYIYAFGIQEQIGGGAYSFDNFSAKQVLGSHASQSTGTNKPLYKTSPSRLTFDSDDSLVITYASSLGSACTVAYGRLGTTPVILTAQTIGTSYTINNTLASDITGLVVINRALSDVETAWLTAWLQAKS